MSYCSGHSKAIIYFRESGGDWDSITSYNPPVNWEYQNTGEGVLVYFALGRNDGSRRFPSDPNIWCINWFNKAHNRPSWDMPDFKTCWAPHTSTCSGGYNMRLKWRDEYMEPLGKPYKNCCVSPLSLYDLWKYNTNVQNRRCLEGWVENVDESHTLIITDSTGEILNKEFSSEPEVLIECGKDCPENTCKVDCGSHYCCYNSNGIAIKKIDK